MRLYATIRNEKGKKEGFGGDGCITVELSFKNKIVGKMGLYTIYSGMGKRILGYRVVWQSENTPLQGNLLEENCDYSKVVKGKQQKDEPRCPKCGNTTTDAGKVYVCDNESCGWNIDK